MAERTDSTEQSHPAVEAEGTEATGQGNRIVEVDEVVCIISTCYP